MKRVLIIAAMSFAGLLMAQKKKSTLGNWKSKDAEIAQKVFSKYEEKEKGKSKKEKMNLLESQRKLKIEIINEGNWEKYNQTVWFRIVKVNNGKLDQIINTDNTDVTVVTNTMATNNWKDEGGGFNFKSISEPMKISQEFVSRKNEKGETKILLKPTEIYETTEPVYSFSLKIYTHKNEGSTPPADLNKTINIYADNQLIKTLKYSLEDLWKTEGVTLRDFKIDTNNSK